MQGAGSRSPRKAWLAVALFAAALCGSPAQAGESTTLNVSAVILTRITCSVVSESSQPKTLCSASDPRTTYRVRSDRDLRAGGPSPTRAAANAVPLIMSIEP